MLCAFGLLWKTKKIARVCAPLVEDPRHDALCDLVEISLHFLEALDVVLALEGHVGHHVGNLLGRLAHLLDDIEH